MPCADRETCKLRKKYIFRKKICQEVAHIRMERGYWLEIGAHRSAAIAKERESRRGE